MAVVVEELVVRLSAQLGPYDAELRRLQSDTARRLAEVERRYQQFGANLNNSVSRAALQANAALAGLGVGLSAAELISYADAWTRVTRSLETTTQVFGVATISAKELSAIAIATRSDLEALSKLYNRTAVAAAKLGLDTGVAAEVTATFAKALKLGQASASEQASALLQFSQALQKGKLDGDEFRSILENAGVVQQALTEKFKVSTGTLFKLASAGKITAKDIIGALQDIKSKVDVAFDGAPATVAEAFTNLKTAIIEYVGTVNQAGTATNILATGIQTLARNIDNIARFLAALALGLGIAFSPAIVASVGAFATSTAALGVTLTGLAAVTSGFAAANIVASDRIRVTGDGVTRLSDLFQALGEKVREGGASLAAYAAQQVTAFLQAAAELFRGGNTSSADFAKNTRDAINSVLGAARTAINGLIGAVVGAADIARAAFLGVFGAIPEYIGNALRDALKQVETFARSVAALLNNIPGVKLDVAAIKLPELINSLEGSAALTQEAWARATKAMTTDYVGQWTAAASAAAKVVVDRAQEIADTRLELDRENRRGRALTNLNPAKPKTFPDEPDKNKFTKEIDQIKRRTEALVAEIAVVGKSTAEQEKARATQELLTKAREAEVKVTPEVRANIEKLATAYGNAAAKLELLRAFQQVREDSAALQREIELTGLYGVELDKARTQAQLLAEARKAGITVGPEQAAEIERLAAQNAALKALNESISSLRDTSQTALKSFISDLRQGKSGAEALGGALDKIADKLFDLAANQAVEAALGGLIGSTGKGSGGGAGLIGKLFGFADGGVMVPGQGPRALNRFAVGGVSRKAAIFGEAGPEAAVPLPDGRRIPVDLRLPNISAEAQKASPGGGSAPNITVAPVFNLSGTVSAEDLANVKREVLTTIPGAVQQGVATAFDRNPRFRRSGL